MLTEEYRQNNIDHVLKVALNICEERGIAALNNTVLAQEAELSSKSIQRYFKDKTDLIYQISEKLNNRTDREIRYIMSQRGCSTMTGLEKLKNLLQVYSQYSLEHYKDVIFLQNAYTHCRFSEDEPAKYWNCFKNSDQLRTAIREVIERGLNDGSINNSYVTPGFAKITAIICVGLIERLSTDIDCKIISLEEAIKISDGWQHHVVSHMHLKAAR